MGTSAVTGFPALDDEAAPVHLFYSDRAWIEGAAVEQLETTARLPGMLKLAAMPDLHPGKNGPVGTAMLADRIYPQLVGNDIGCGMALYRTDLPVRKLRIERTAGKLRAIEEPFAEDPGSIRSRYDVRETDYDRGLGSIGGGNHFLEVQAIDTLFDGDVPDGLDPDVAYLLVHSGSRALGHAVFLRTLDGHDSGLLALDPDSAEGRAYLAAHDEAVRWAMLNRRLIAEKAARALRTELVPVADIPHNAVEVTDAGVLHRKGAARAVDPLVPIAGSRASLSFLVAPTGRDADALSSLAHGAGRKYDRASMHGRVGRTRSDREALARNRFGGIAVCEDRNLLVEEAASAYKRAEDVIADLERFELARPVAALRPLVTFKTAGGGRPAQKRENPKRENPKREKKTWRRER